MDQIKSVTEQPYANFSKEIIPCKSHVKAPLREEFAEVRFWEIQMYPPSNPQTMQKRHVWKAGIVIYDSVLACNIAPLSLRGKYGITSRMLLTLWNPPPAREKGEKEHLLSTANSFSTNYLESRSIRLWSVHFRALSYTICVLLATSCQLYSFFI